MAHEDYQEQWPTFDSAIGTYSVVPVSFFFDNLAPAIAQNDDEFDDILKSLKPGKPKKKSPRPAVTQSGRLWGFPVDPAASKAAEQDAFDHLHNFVHVLRNKIGEPLYDLEFRKNVKMTDDEDEDLPDLYLVQRTRQVDEPRARRIVASGALTKRGTVQTKQEV